MGTLSADELIEQMRWRYATKQFDAGRKIPAEDWAALEAALILAPSSFGLQPWKFVVVTDDATKGALVKASWGQTQLAECSHVVVFAAKTQVGEAEIDFYLDKMAEVREIERGKLTGFRTMLTGFVSALNDAARGEWAEKQVYIALGTFLTACAAMGVDACPLEGLEPKKYDEILELEQEGCRTVVAAAAGYRASGDKYAALKKVRFDVGHVIVRR